jgi:hypothetical protein
MTAEARTVANEMGIAFRWSIDKCIVGADQVGNHTTSLLQDDKSPRKREQAGCGPLIVLRTGRAGTGSDRNSCRWRRGGSSGWRGSSGR